MKLLEWFICALALLGIALSLLGQGSAAAAVTASNEGQKILDSLEENANCSVDDPFPSDSEGNQKVTCFPGHRKGSEENPCPDGETCCVCDRGTYQPNDNTCDKCIRHTVCIEYDVVGDPFQDAVCRATAAPTDTVLTESHTILTTGSTKVTSTPTVSRSTESHTVTPAGSTKITSPPRESHTITAAGSTKITSTPRDAVQDKKFSIPWPWSLVVLVFIVAMTLLLVCAVVRRTMKWHRKHIRGYNIPPPDDNMQLDVINVTTSPQQPQENGNIPAQAAACAIPVDGPNEMTTDDES